jgi:Flp pilus assembly pilin Flp
MPEGNMSKLLAQLLRDERGGEVIEYVLLLGLLIIGCLTALSAMGIKVVDRWTRILDLL